MNTLIERIIAAAGDMPDPQHTAATSPRCQSGSFWNGWPRSHGATPPPRKSNSGRLYAATCKPRYDYFFQNGKWIFMDSIGWCFFWILQRL